MCIDWYSCHCWHRLWKRLSHSFTPMLSSSSLFADGLTYIRISGLRRGMGGCNHPIFLRISLQALNPQKEWEKVWTRHVEWLGSRFGKADIKTQLNQLKHIKMETSLCSHMESLGHDWRGCKTSPPKQSIRDQCNLWTSKLIMLIFRNDEGLDTLLLSHVGLLFVSGVFYMPKTAKSIPSRRQNSRSQSCACGA